MLEKLTPPIIREKIYAYSDFAEQAIKQKLTKIARRAGTLLVSLHLCAGIHMHTFMCTQTLNCSSV